MRRSILRANHIPRGAPPSSDRLPRAGWLDPIEILTATAAIYIVVVFAVSALGKALADVLRRRYGLAGS